MKRTTLFLVLLLAIACNRKNDEIPAQYKSVDLSEQNCEFHIEPRAHLDKVTGIVSCAQADVSRGSIMVLKTANGKLYAPCYLPEECRQGLHVIFSGDIYGSNPAALYPSYMEPIFSSGGGQLKLSDLWMEDKGK